MTSNFGRCRLLLGIDAGGTKTECALVSLPDGRVSRHWGDPSNYQGVGIAQATEVWRHLIGQCCADLGVHAGDIAGAGLGIAGLDRPRDEERIAAAFDSLLPGLSRVLVNDAYLVLRAGTPDGVGVTAISGTGANAMGEATDGRRFRVNGLGPDFGDFGSASDIGAEAVRRAFRSLDFRDKPTLLCQMITEALHLEQLTDLVDLMLFDSPQPAEYHPGYLAPLVIRAAAQGDSVAVEILQWAGAELGLASLAVARQLFQTHEAFPLVLGGSVLQKGRSPFMVDRLVGDVRSEFPGAYPLVLGSRPVLGAMRYALDVSLGAGWKETEFAGLYAQLDEIVNAFDDVDTVAMVRGNQ